MHTSIVFFSDPYISHMHAVYKHALSPPNPQRHTHKITILTLSHTGHTLVERLGRTPALEVVILKDNRR